VKRIASAAILAGSVLAYIVPAHASSDMGCVTRIRPTASTFTDCDSTALLTPGNDTRVNMTLLFADRHGTPLHVAATNTDPAKQPAQVVPFGWSRFANTVAPVRAEDTGGSSLFSMGEGTVCVSNDRGQTDFVAALDSDRKVPSNERERLSGARKAFNCEQSGDGASSFDDEKAIHSDTGLEFLAYLRAALSFYAGNYDAAAFQSLSKSRQPWVREASHYMVGRTWALAAQGNGFGTYGEIEHDKMDRVALDKAEAALKGYIKAYPHGEYTASAYGLLRRVYWLGGDTTKLAEAYAWQIDQRDATLRNVEDAGLAQEIDAKLPLDAYQATAAHVVLLAVDDLRRMRQDRAGQGEVLTRQALEAQRGRFGKDKALYEYLLAAHAYFVEKSPKEVLRLIPPAASGKPMDSVEFSRRMLRALALDATADTAARDALVELFPGATAAYQHQTLQIALAMRDERTDALARVFAADSKITDPMLREVLLQNVAGPDLLRERAKDADARLHERNVALFTLLYKSLTRGRYADFVADTRLLPAKPAGESDRYYKLGDVVSLDDFRWAGTTEGYSCTGIVQVATTLSKTPDATKANLCLADFVRINGYDHFELDTPPPEDQLGGTKSLFPGSAYARQKVYQHVIADPTAAANDKAYALYRAVRCYAPAGFNDCGGEDVPLATRKAWFKQLKSAYPASTWAKQLDYFW
jgi:hypothetical protein